MSEDILDPAHVDDAPAPVAAVAGISSPEPKADNEPAPRVSDDGNIVEVGGKKYITMEALQSERQQRQQLAQTLATLDPVMPEFQEWLTQRNNRQNANVERTRQSTRPANPDYSDDELEGFAITRGYFKEDNTTPDLSRAQRELDIISGINRRVTRQEIEPVSRLTRAEAARVNRERASGRKFVDGQPIADQRYIDTAFDSLPPEMAADPNVANLTQVIAAGLEYLEHRKNGTLPSRGVRRAGGREPMYLEQGTGRFDGDNGELSSLDLAAARARGKTPEEWAKLTRSINKGNSLEEI